MDDVNDIVNNYFILYPSKTKKSHRISLINEFYRLKTLKAHIKPIKNKNVKLHEEWLNFINYEWNKWML